MTKAIQELNTKHGALIEAKDTQISAIESQMTAILARLDALEAQL